MESFPQNLESEIEKIDRKSPEILEALKKAPLYRKFGMVHARPAKTGERLATITASGLTETERTANEGDWVVTNPTGEIFIIPESTFLSRNEKTDQEGVYSAKGFCKAIKNPYNKPIEIMASWGEPQNGDENCFIADTCDKEENMKGEPYIIDGTAFEKTYKLYN
jgi:hypothetical protein